MGDGRWEMGDGRWEVGVAKTTLEDVWKYVKNDREWCKSPKFPFSGEI